MRSVRLPFPALAFFPLAACAGAIPQAEAPAPVAAPAPPAPAIANPTVGGATRSIAESVAATPNLSALAGAVRAAELTAALSGPGPLTLFAPTDAAFGRLAPDARSALLQPENRASLVRVLNYHIVPGSITAADLRGRIQAGGGTVNLTTAAGDILTARFENGAITLTDMNGTKTFLETPDLRGRNGVMHVVNGVLAPRLD